MSKIGKKPIIIPEDVIVEIKDGFLNVKKGVDSQNIKILPFIEAEIFEEEKEGGSKQKTLKFKKTGNSKTAQTNWGTIRSITQNAIDGFSKGFFKNLIIEGIGYRAAQEGENLVLNLGFSHPVKFTPPKGVKLTVEKNIIKISGFDKMTVGQTAANIRAFKKPEPYKGKGIRYEDEIVRRKAVKKTVVTAK